MQALHAHSQFCLSGDHTLEAAKHAVESIVKQEADEHFVIVLSDANLDRYGIRPKKLAEILSMNDDVNAYVIFIGSLGDQAQRFVYVYVCVYVEVVCYSTSRSYITNAVLSWPVHWAADVALSVAGLLMCMCDVWFSTLIASSVIKYDNVYNIKASLSGIYSESEMSNVSISSPAPTLSCDYSCTLL